MNRKTRWITVGAITVALVGGGAGAAMAAADDGGDKPITGPALAKASAAALAYTQDGRVTDTEAGDEDSLYEVEVTRANGDEVDVQLDKDFKVVGSQTDRETGPDDD